MALSNQNFNPYSFVVSDQLIAEVSILAHRLTGVQLGENQKTMVSTRIAKRIMELDLNSSEEYLLHLKQHGADEEKVLVSLLTTHHTFFFREFIHFEYLKDKILPAAIERAKLRGDKKIRIWSAACSRGQEVYSLSMFISNCLKVMAPDFKFEIFGSDVDPDSVQIGKNAVYLWDELKEAPMQFLTGNWARGTGEIAHYVKAKSSIKDPCSFEAINLFQLPAIDKTGLFDAIFCRNVFIYFKPEQIKLIVTGLISRLHPHGSLVIGVSESLMGLGLALNVSGPSVYTKVGQLNLQAQLKSTGVGIKESIARVAISSPVLRVLCVDDSPTILALLKKILVPEHGFEVVGTALNGIEALKLQNELKPDVMTLDIHMPEQDGIAYLAANFRKGHPPVMMLTSVSRENADLAIKALNLGASDYVEKPSLTNMKEKSEEIRIKLKTAFAMQAMGLGPAKSELETSFKSNVQIPDCETKLRIISCGGGDLKRLTAFFGELQGDQPPTLIALPGLQSLYEEFCKQLKAQSKYYFESLNSSEIKPGTSLPKVELKKNRVYLFDSITDGKKIYDQNRDRSTSILVYGRPESATANLIAFWIKAELLVEDLGDASAGKKDLLLKIAKDIVPVTSFAYMSSEFLSKGTFLTKRSAA